MNWLALIIVVLWVIDANLARWFDSRPDPDDKKHVVRDVQSVGFVVPEPRAYPMGEYGDEQYPEEE